MSSNLINLFTVPLHENKITYMVTGSLASIIYGEPRLTNDVDVVVELTPGQSEALRNLYSQQEFYVPPEEVIEIEASRRERGHFSIIHFASGLKADIYLVGEAVIQKWGIENRRLLETGSTPLWIAAPEYVIIKKLEFFREGRAEKHLRDIQSMLEISAKEIDLRLLAEKVEQLGLQQEWQVAAKGH